MQKMSGELIRKRRQCPHCKSKKGFKITFYRKGYIEQTFNFRGKLKETIVEAIDDADSYVVCLECKKSFPLECVEYDC